MLDVNLIDPVAFAKSALLQEDSISLTQLDERVAQHEFLAHADTTLHYRLKGGVDKLQRPFVDLSIQGELQLACQRCLSALPFVLDETVRIVLFSDETVLDEAMDSDPDLEGMLAESELSVWSLLEDQIIMALPYAPRHDDCGNDDLERVNADKPNPFAQLAKLKRNQ